MISHGSTERERYRLDNIYTILEKSLFPIKFNTLQKNYREMLSIADKEEKEKGASFSPFRQVDYLLKLLNVHDSVIFKKVYDCYIDAVLQISPKLSKNAEKALSILKERGKKIGLISTMNKTPGDIMRLLFKELSIYHYFDDMTFSDEAGIIHPFSVLFEITLKKLRLPKKEAIYIGDLKNDDYNSMATSGYNMHLFKNEEEDIYQLALKYSGGYL